MVINREQLRTEVCQQVEIHGYDQSRFSGDRNSNASYTQTATAMDGVHTPCPTRRAVHDFRFGGDRGGSLAGARTGAMAGGHGPH
jgi:hypothetical protein